MYCTVGCLGKCDLDFLTFSKNVLLPRSYSYYSCYITYSVNNYQRQMSFLMVLPLSVLLEEEHHY